MTNYVYKNVDFSLMGDHVIQDIENGKSNTIVVFETEEEMVNFVVSYREVFDKNLSDYWKIGFAKHAFRAGKRALRIDKGSNELWIQSHDQFSARVLKKTEKKYHVVYFKNLIVSESDDFNESSLPIKSLFCV